MQFDNAAEKYSLNNRKKIFNKRLQRFRFFVRIFLPEMIFRARGTQFWKPCQTQGLQTEKKIVHKMFAQKISLNTKNSFDNASENFLVQLRKLFAQSAQKNQLFVRKFTKILLDT